MKAFKVLDTSGMLRSNMDLRGGMYVLPPSVLEEVCDPILKAVVDQGVGGGSIKVVDPKQEYVKRVLDAAEKTGDIESLSTADVDVLALALQKKISIVSDDYAIQNTASHLGLRYEKTAHEGISKKGVWVYVCSGCGRPYAKPPAKCSICGSNIRRTLKED